MSSEDVTIELWAVIRAEGAGHIEATAHDKINAILRYCYHRISKEPTHDFKSWWRENAKKRNLVCQKIKVSTAHIPGVPFSSGWTQVAPKADRCEWDMGHKTICIQQCNARGKFHVDGHRLCGLHHMTYLRQGKLILATL